jgi:4-hydroxy-tetrahydrodipicolinate reductase
MLKIGIFGATGRMGKNLIEAVLNDTHASLHSATARASSAFLGIDAGTLIGQATCGIPLVTYPEIEAKSASVFIDFTLPESLEAHLAYCVEQQRPIVIGTTGLSSSQLAMLEEAAKSIPIVFAANYSVGVNLLIKLAQQTAAVMGDSADIEIIETHHRFKVDAPSGTALALGEGIAETTGRDLTNTAVYGREGYTGERDQQTIGFATVRGGDVVGDHTVLFADIGERIELTHKASSRMTFAKGAVKAAHWVVDQPAGLYSMMDVLEL